MSKKCANCGRSESEIFADAKALGLYQQLQCGIYTCCQISQWAEEQSAAWFEATHDDAMVADEMIRQPDVAAADPVLVPVRMRRPQVPWHRNPDDLS
jgi:hypothetical protein